MNCDAWEDEKMIRKRTSSLNTTITTLYPNIYNVIYSTSKDQSCALFDYILNARCFNSAKIPIFLIYKIETNETNASSLVIQYKVNEKWNESLIDVEIFIQFKSSISAYEVNTIPKANEIMNDKILWKVTF